MDEQIHQTLANIGLDETEIAIYLYTLRNGASSQQELAEKTGLLRQTIYDRVRKLESKGILSRTNQVTRLLFVAVPPKIFLEQIKEKEQQIKEMIPILEKFSKNKKNQTTSSIFTSLKALKKLMQLTLTTQEEILWISNKKINDEVFSEHFWHNYAVRRKEKDISIKLLIEPTKEKEWKTNKKNKRFTRTHPFVVNQKSSMVVFGDQIILYTAEEGMYYGINIKDKNMAQFFTDLFEKLWKEGKEV